MQLVVYGVIALDGPGGPFTREGREGQLVQANHCVPSTISRDLMMFSATCC